MNYCHITGSRAADPPATSPGLKYSTPSRCDGRTLTPDRRSEPGHFVTGDPPLAFDLVEGLDAPPRVRVVLLDDASQARQREHLGDQLDDAIGGIGEGGAHATMQRRDVHALKRRRLQGAPLGHDVLGDPPLIELLGTFMDLGVAFQVGGAEFGDRVAEARTFALDQGIDVVLAQPELVAEREVSRLFEGEFGGAPEGDEALSPLMTVAEDVGLLAIGVNANSEATQRIVPVDFARRGGLRVNERVDESLGQMCHRHDLRLCGPERAIHTRA